MQNNYLTIGNISGKTIIGKIPEKTALRGLIKIVTKTEIDSDLLFLRRTDTGQTVNSSDLVSLKELPSNYPLSHDMIKKGKIYFPTPAIPDGANSIAFITTRYGENAFMYSVHFCRLTLREDDGIRTIAERELGDGEPLYGTIKFEIITSMF